MSDTNKDKNRDYQLVIYGASGFTGQLATKYIDKHYPSIKWGIAGRNKSKLNEIANNCSNKPDVLYAESTDEQSLNNVTSSTQVLLSFAGPFNKYSNLMVKSCFNNNTHYIDITGENIWVRDLIDEFHEDAVKKRIKIIPSCGYDSIPSDIGTYYSCREVGSPIKSIDCYQSGQGGISGGTIESGFSMMEYKTKNKIGHTFLLNPINSYSENQKQRSKDKFSIKKIPELSKWSAPFIMAPANTRVVRRSSAIFEQNQKGYGQEFVYNEHMSVKNYVSALMVSFALITFGFILSLPFRRLFRPLMTKAGNGPSKKVQDAGWFKSVFIISTEDNKKYITSMYGDGDPGYKSTARFACESALSLIFNQDDLPTKDGGVLTSATGLGDAIIKRLSEKGVKFEAPREI